MVNNKHHGTPGHEAARGTQKDHELCWMLEVRQNVAALHTPRVARTPYWFYDH